MASNPLVTILIPAYNRADTINRAIDSALAQDWPVLEVLVVDDGSTDQTPELVRHYAEPRLRLIERSKNGGAAAARNTGLAAARGDYIAFLDSDDELLPGKITTQVQALCAAPDDQQLSCTALILHLLDQGLIIEKRHAPARDDFLRMYLACDLSPGSTLMARRDVFDRVGLLDESLKRFEDWDWLLRYTHLGGRILIVNELLSRVYNRKSRLSADVRQSIGRFAAKITQEYPDVSHKLRRRTLLRLWIQLYSTAWGERRADFMLEALFRGVCVDPAGFGLGLLRQLNNFRRRMNAPVDPVRQAMPARPSVSMVIHGIAPGGAERVMSLLANSLAARGWAVSLIVYQNADQQPFYPLSADVDYAPLGFRKWPRNWLFRKFYYIYQLVALRRTIRRKGSRVVLSFMDAVNVHTVLSLIGAGLPVVVSERNDPAVHRCEPVIDILRRLLYPRAAAIIVQTENAATYFEPHLQPDIFVLPNPLPVKTLQGATAVCQTHRKEIVAIGRLDPQKGFDILLRAFGRVAAEEPDWRLTIYGEGKLLDDLTALRDALNLHDRVDLPGVTDDVPGALDKAEIFVLSSRYEGFPNALLEAMACGVASVSFDCRSGPAEIIRHGVDGLLVPAEREDALANAMLSLIRDPVQRARLGAAAAKSVARFDEKPVVDEWESLLARMGGM